MDPDGRPLAHGEEGLRLAAAAVVGGRLFALTSAEAPIVLVRRRSPDAGHRPPPLPPLARAVAPGKPRIRARLPYTPPHHLLAGVAGRLLICTSGNLSGEPMCTQEDEAATRLAAVADVFLLHERLIVRPVDDSIARVGPVSLERLRRARGSRLVLVSQERRRVHRSHDRKEDHIVRVSAGDSFRRGTDGRLGEL